MLNGLVPIIIIQYYSNADNSPREKENYVESFKKYKKAYNNYKEIPTLIKNGLPLVIPLSEELFKVIVIGESVKMSANVTNIDTNDKVRTIQTSRQHSVNLNLTVDSSNILTSVLIAALQFCWENLNQYNYDISYFYNAIFVKQGMLGNFTVNTTNNKSLIDIGLTLEVGEPPVKKGKEEQTKIDTNNKNNPLQTKTI
jgi:hypothetical protein